MPQRHCCISTCNSAEIEGAVLHAFPNPVKEPEKFSIWVTNAGLIGEDEMHVFKNRRICRLHFEEIYLYPKNRLNKYAVPMLHLPGAPQQSADSLVRPEPVLSQPITTIFDNSTSLASASTSNEAQLLPSNDVEKQNPKENIKGLTERKNKHSKDHQYKKLSKTETELFNTVIKTQAALKRCTRLKNSMRQRLKVAKNFCRSEAFNAVTKELSPAAKTFFEMQVRQGSKDPKGRRFTLDEKILALSLYKPSPKAYRMLSQICVLPKKGTLNKLLTKVCLLPGPNNKIIYEHLKKKVAKMPRAHRYCTIIFDEMAISPNLSYDKLSDKIKGFCDDGSERKKIFANHALVFMIRGIFKKYKQPISFSFCKGTTKTENLKKQIIAIIKNVSETGLKIVSTTCDQGATNLAAINSLINDTKADFCKKGEQYKGGFFEVDGVQIFPIYDPPHLMKGIRNNLLTKNLEFQINGKKHLAKWTHLEALYKRGPGFKGMRLIPKLTALHVIPQKIPKMKVKYCTQVFSRTVSIGMGYTAGTGRIPRESTETAELLLFFDKLFDSVNGSFNKPKKGKIYRSAVTPKSPHHQLWRSSLVVLKSMKFIGGRVSVVPSISSWIKTIEAFQEITKKLHTVGLRSLLLRNFNQDPLENFFGAIRSHGHSNTKPSTSAFESSYKSLLINNMVSPKSIGTNCEKDDGYCLQSLKYFLLKEKDHEINVPDISINENHLNIKILTINALLNSPNSVELENCAAAAYCGGWLINLIYKKIAKKCEQCRKYLEGDGDEEYNKFITLKKYSDKSLLHYPSKAVLECFMNIENITNEILKTDSEIIHISEYIELIITTLLPLNFINCETHKNAVINFILKRSIIFFINNWCKDVSGLLSGRNVLDNANDPVKVCAYEYYLKNKRK